MFRKNKKTKKKSELEDVEYPDEVEEEGFIDELDDEKEEEKEVPEIEPKEEWKKVTDVLESVADKHGKSISINQKYIKKIWEKVKELEDNFKLLIEK